MTFSRVSSGLLVMLGILGSWNPLRGYLTSSLSGNLKVVKAGVLYRMCCNCWICPLLTSEGRRAISESQ